VSKDEWTVSRREFLKLAGMTGAAVGIGGGLGGLIAACGEGETTTSEGASTTVGATTTTEGAATTVSTEAEMGPEIKIGFVTPKTGALAPFASTDNYLLERFREAVGEGQLLGDGKVHAIGVETADSQSDPNRASQVAGDLILNSNVALMMVASTPDTVNPVTNQCDAMSTPCVATDVPWQVWMGSEPEVGWKWSWLFCLGIEDFSNNYIPVWNALPTNKLMGVMWPNDADGNGFAEFMPPIIESAGITFVDAGRWQPASEDFTQQITLFKKEGCELLQGPFTTPDFTNFWKQCHQQGWVPKIACIDKGLLYPQAIEAVGAPLGYNLTSTMFFAPTWPYKNYFCGDTCQEFADEFTKRTGEQWSSALEHSAIFEMALWVLRNAADPASRESINATIPTMKFEGMCGLVDFSAPIEDPIPGPRRVHEHVYKEPVMAGQWVKGTHGNAFDYVSVSNVAAPNIPVDAELLPIEGNTAQT